MFEIKALKEKLGEAKKEKQKLTNRQSPLINKFRDLANKERISDSDLKRMEEMKPEIDNLNNKITAQNQIIDEVTDKLLDMGSDAQLQQDLPPNISRGAFSSSPSEDVEIWRSAAEGDRGREIKALGPGASVQEHADFDRSGDWDMAQYLRDRVRGFTNEMSTTADAALVPGPLSSMIIDKARNKSRVMQAGARTVLMDSKTLTIAKVSEDSNVEWKEENLAHTPSDVSFVPLTFTAKTLIGSVKSSVELAEDSNNLANLVTDNLAQQIALELDRAAMMGSGVDPEPEGITSNGSVQLKDIGTPDGAPLTDYSEFSLAVQNILAANGDPNAVIYNPREWGTLDRLTDSTGQPLQAPQSYKDLEKYQTEQIPTNLTFGNSNDASLAIVADWSKLMIGIRQNIRLELTRVGSDSDNSAWSNLQIWFRAYARYDVQLAIPNHFYVINAITGS